MIYSGLGTLTLVNFDFDDEVFANFEELVVPERHYEAEPEDEDDCELEYWGESWDEHWRLRLSNFMAGLTLARVDAIELAELLLENYEGEPLNEIAYRLERARKQAV
jgi:hypothetical protein